MENGEDLLENAKKIETKMQLNYVKIPIFPNNGNEFREQNQ